MITHDDVRRAHDIAAKACSTRRWLIDDAYGAALEALAKAEQTFDGRGTWSGYSGQRMAWAARDEIKRQAGRGAARAIRQAGPLPEPTDTPPDELIA